MYFKTTPWCIRRLFPKLIWKIPEPDCLYLTFDDGPHPETTPRILALLDQINAKASFFLLGVNAQRYPELLKSILDAGHTVGWHGYLHLNGWKTPTNQYIQNVEKCQKIMSSSYFRPPYGKITPNQIKHLSKKYKLVLWSNMPGDFDEKINTEEMQKRILNVSADGSIVVLHDNPKSIDNCTAALSALIKNGDTAFKKIA